MRSTKVILGIMLFLTFMAPVVAQSPQLSPQPLPPSPAQSPAQYKFSNAEELAKSVVMFRAVVSYRGGARSIGASAVVVKKIQQDGKTVLYVTTPPGPIFSNSDSVAKDSGKYISVNNFEFAAEISGDICWSAETVPLKVIIQRDNPAYLPTIYEDTVKRVAQIPAWQTGNRYPSTTGNYWVIGYDYVGEVWELVRVKSVLQKATYLGSDTRIPPPGQIPARPIITYRFGSENARAAGTAGNIVVDENGALIAIVLDVVERKSYAKDKPPEIFFTAVPAQVVYECLKTFFEQSKIPFP